MVTLIQQNNKSLGQQRWLWSLMLTIWLLTLSINIAHSPKHTLKNENQCQLCLSNFQHTPFIIIQGIIVVPTSQLTVFITLKLPSIAKQLPAIFYNRGPPFSY